MPEQTTPQPPSSQAGATDEQPWDPHKILRDRTVATRRDRDKSIAELRSAMDDEMIRDEFGIDLGEIEN